MNKAWSELNRKMQIQLKKEATFTDGIETLFELRKKLMQAADGFFRDLSREEFCAIPFLNAEGTTQKQSHIRSGTFSELRTSWRTR